MREENKRTANETAGLSDTIMVYLERGAADGNGEDKMLTLALQKKYVKSYHTSAITQMKNASGYKKNSWKTRVLIDGKQKTNY